jgi:hypothetical protein
MAAIGNRRVQTAGDTALAFVLAASSVAFVLAGDHTS